MTTEIQHQAWADDLRPATRLWYLLLLLPIVATIAFAVFQPIQVLPRISLAPAYSLQDQQGEQVTSEDMRGNLVIYTFAHSRCVAPCVPTSATLAALQPALANLDLKGIPLHLVTLYVDEAASAPGQLNTLADELWVETEPTAAAQWRLLTGDADQLKHVIGAGFHTYYSEDTHGNFVVDPVFVLVDGWGIVRATYRTAAPDIDLLKRDLGLIVQEIENSTGVSRYAYEAAHLFMCYPR
jgi:protein SCO1